MIRLSAQEIDQLVSLVRAPDDDAADVSPDLLFRAALLESSIENLPWQALVRLARRVLSRSDIDADAWEKVAFARDVARRHVGEPALLEWPRHEGWFTALDGATQLVALAHVVQSAADADLEVVASYAEAASALLDGAPVTAEALTLRGALGRAHAAVGAYAEATHSLQSAVEGWFAIGDVPSASHPLCELLRVRGVQGDGTGVQELGARLEQFFAVTTDVSSRAFARLAQGRACLQTGALDEGRLALADGAASWAESPPATQASRLRWLHFAEVTFGDDGAATRLRDELDTLRDQEGEPYDSDQRYLARIDRALARGTLLTPHVDELLALLPEGDEAARTLARLAPSMPRALASNDRAVVKRLAWEYRY